MSQSQVLDINAQGKDLNMQSGDKKRITQKFMTKFEIARVIGARAQQLAMGAPPTISPPTSKGGQLDPLMIAKLELEQYKVPMIIRRPLPDGTYEDWAISDFDPNKGLQQ